MYGDLTPFPHDVDFVALLRDGVSCAVRLASAQFQIESVQEQQERSRQEALLQREALTELYTRVEKASQSTPPSATTELASKAADSIVTAGRRLVDSALCQLCSEYSQTEQRATGKLEEEQTKSFRAVADFFRDHTPPGSNFHVDLQSQGAGYVGALKLKTSLGLNASFKLDVPQGCTWSKQVRVENFDSGVVVHLPQRALYQGAQPTMVPVRLDTFVIVSAQVNPDGGKLTLKERNAAGAQLTLEWLGSGEIVGKVHDLPSWPLCGLDMAGVANLWRHIVDTTTEVAAHRGEMTEASFEGTPLGEVSAPSKLARKIIGELAPLTVELNRRSEVPGQLELREIGSPSATAPTRLSHETLLEEIRTLPAEQRSLFLPLRLHTPSTQSTTPPPRRQPLAS